MFHGYVLCARPGGRRRLSAAKIHSFIFFDSDLFLFSIAIVAPVGFVISIRLLEFSCLLTLPPLRASSVRALGLRGLALRGLASPRLFEITQFFEKLVLF